MYAICNVWHEMLKCVFVTYSLFLVRFNTNIYNQLLSILYSNCILKKVCVVTILGVLDTPLAQQVKKSFRHTTGISRRNLLQEMNDGDTVMETPPKLPKLFSIKKFYSKCVSDK